jgi:transposase
MNGRGFITISMHELERVKIIEAVVQHRLTIVLAAERRQLCERQVSRLVRRYEAAGPAGLISARRGQPSNRELPVDIRARAMALVRERYADFGPTLACEKLAECHGVMLAKETVRRWMREAGLWIPPQTAAAEAASAEKPSRVPGRAGADRWQRSPVVRGTRTGVHAAGIH